MRKISIKLSFILCSILASAFLFTTLAASEDITITTYYPSPYGVYNELQSQRIAVGDTNSDGNITSADQPSRDGDIRLTPQAGDPSTWLSGREGQVAYSDFSDSIYHYTGSNWVSAGGGGSFTYYCTSSSGFGSPQCVNAGGTQGYCPAGYAQKADLGSWGVCAYSAASFNCDVFLPPGGGCAGDPGATRFFGRAYICSQN